MHIKWLKCLKSPVSDEELELKVIKQKGDIINEGKLIDSKNNKIWQVYNGVADFINAPDYSESFGQQWTMYRKTLIDSFSDRSYSEDLFYKYTNWEINHHHSYLDLGCGSGRFADVILKKNVKSLVCIDSSSAAFACQKNLKEIGYNEENFLVIRASVFNLPFYKHCFDRVFSIGVLQHTPDAENFVMHCAENVKKEGELAIWTYEKTIKAYLRYKYLVRFISKSWNLSSRVTLSKILVKLFLPIFFPISFVSHKLFKEAGVYIDRIAPFALRFDKNYKYCHDMSVLDTIDNLTPIYDIPISEKKLTQYLIKFGAKSIKRTNAGGLAMIAVF